MTEPVRTGELLQKTAGGAGWTIAWRTVTRTLGFLSTLVLARILVPADFGLVALAMSFAKAIDIFSDLGVQDALVRLKNPGREAYDAAFTVNAIRGSVTALIIAGAAQPFATFFHEPRLFYVVLALAASVLLDTLENVGVADFRRDFAFRREFQLSIIPRLAQVGVTIVLALTWRNYWALVIGILTMKVLQNIASYLMHPYRPRLSLAGWRDIVSFSFWSWLIGMGWMVRSRGVTMIVGRMLQTTGLGVFTVGTELATLPDTELLAPLDRVCFASFAAAHRTGMSVTETFMRITSTVLVFAIPAGIGISSIAAALVSIAVGAKWLAAVPVVQILALATMSSVFGRMGWALLSAFGYLRPLFWIVVSISLYQLALLVVLVDQAGLIGAAIATALGQLTEHAIYVVVAFRRFSMHPVDLLRRIWRGLFAAAGMAAFLVVSGLGWSGEAGDFAASAQAILLTSASGASVYAALLLLLWLASGRPAGPERDMLELIRRTAINLRGTLRRYLPLPWTAGSR